jgi:hypothetical protein
MTETSVRRSQRIATRHVSLAAPLWQRSDQPRPRRPWRTSCGSARCASYRTMYFRFRRYPRHFGAFQVRRRHMGYIALVWGRLVEHVASFVTTRIGME